MKRLVVCMMVIISLFSVSVVPGFAAAIDPGESETMPCYDYAESVAVSLDVSKGGTATATAEIAGYPGTTTKVSVYMYLERKEDGKWVTVESWSERTSSHSVTLEESVDVDSGYTYRVRTSCYAYSGTASEHITKYSQEVDY